MHGSSTKKGLVALSIVASVFMGGAGIVAGASQDLYPHEIAVSDLGGGGALLATSCATTSSCTAVGYDNSGQPLVLTGDPANWSASNARELTLAGAFADAGTLYAVDCITATSCVAVGSDKNGQPIIARGDPATWSAASVTEISLGGAFGNHGTLYGVSCAAMSQCTAVGVDADSQPLWFTGDPASWNPASATSVALGSGYGYGGYLGAVSCVSASQCTAVGFDKAGNNQPFTLTGNPSSWGVTATTSLTLASSLGSGGYLDGVNCVSASQCTAVGYDGNNQPLVVTGDPASWNPANAVEVTLGAAFGDGGSLGAVACSSPTSCTAVGGNANGLQPIALEGDPATWSSASAVNFDLSPAYGGGGDLAGVTCSAAGQCTAVGDDANNQPLVMDGSDTYAVVYSANGGLGTVPTRSGAVVGTTVTASSGAGLTKAGYSFDGWSEGTQLLRPGATFVMPEANVSLAAQWSVQSTTNHLRLVIHFSAESASLSVASRTSLQSLATLVQRSRATSLVVTASAARSERDPAALAHRRAQVVVAYERAQLRRLHSSRVELRVTILVPSAKGPSSSATVTLTS